MKVLEKILKIIITIFLIAIIVINFTLILKASINQDKIPDFLGYTPFIIVSGSMEPAININDIIVTKNVKESELKVGDVISYISKKDNIVITHRINEILEQNGTEVYVLKGDNNNNVDKEYITYSSIQGKYIFTIPLLGTIVSYVKTPLGLFFCIAAILLIYAIFEMERKNIKTNKKIRLKVPQ